MTLRSWDPFRELSALRREVERAFDDFGTWRRPFSRYSFLPGLGARSSGLGARSSELGARSSELGATKDRFLH